MTINSRVVKCGSRTNKLNLKSHYLDERLIDYLDKKSQLEAQKEAIEIRSVKLTEQIGINLLQLKIS